MPQPSPEAMQRAAIWLRIATAESTGKVGPHKPCTTCDICEKRRKAGLK
jgi:hypothetical protein